MLIASAKSRSASGASHQPAVMVNCLTISHTCFPILPSGRVSHCVHGFTEVGSCCYSRKWVWSSRWECARFLVLFKGGKHRVNPRFYIFVSDVNQRNEEDGLKISLRACRDRKTLFRSSACC